MTTAKVFWTGRSQAVRLPKEFRFDTDKVSIRRQGDEVVLKPVSDDWAWLRDLVGQVDDDFIAAVEEQMSEQERPELDDLFK